MQLIPFVPSKPNYIFTTTITDDDGVPEVYNFRVRWSASESGWYFDVRDADGKLIRAGIKIVLGAALGRTSNHKLFRNGCMMAFDTSGKGKDAGLDDMGTRVKVLRLTRAEALLAHDELVEAARIDPVAP